MIEVVYVRSMHAVLPRLKDQKQENICVLCSLCKLLQSDEHAGAWMDAGYSYNITAVVASLSIVYIGILVLPHT